MFGDPNRQFFCLTGEKSVRSLVALVALATGLRNPLGENLGGQNAGTGAGRRVASASASRSVSEVLPPVQRPTHGGGLADG